MAKKSSGVINIPLDLVLEILEKLPAKSLARFRCVSSQWEGLINIIVIDSIVTRRLNPPPRDPHFFFDKRLKPPRRGTFYRPFSFLSYTYLYHQVTDVEQLYHEEIIGKGEGYLKGFQYVRGLMGFWCSDYGQFRIHNPTTRQSVSLPITRLPESLFYLFGYDPFKNQYKVLCLTNQRDQSCKLFVLGDPSEQWWDIQCSIGAHFLREQAVCINGTIYYRARKNYWSDHVLVSFDVRHEKFNYVETPEYLLSGHYGDWTLVNYHGKLGCVCDSLKMNGNGVDLWVMEDAEKQAWSRSTFSVTPEGLPTWNMRFAGVTDPGGEFVLVHQNYLSEFALNVYYYDPKLNSHRRAEIQTTTSLFRIRPLVRELQSGLSLIMLKISCVCNTFYLFKSFPI